MRFKPSYIFVIPMAVLVIFLVIGSLSYTTSNKNPSIVVNMPANAQPLEQLTDKVVIADAKVINDERAILWWTVFKCLADQGYTKTAADIADQAVETAYGKAK